MRLLLCAGWGGAASARGTPHTLLIPTQRQHTALFPRLLGVVDGKRAWAAPPNVTLVQTGDATDRGPRSAATVRLLARLQRGAAAAGGRVVTLLGNHDLMNLQVCGGYCECMRMRMCARVQVAAFCVVPLIDPPPLRFLTDRPPVPQTPRTRSKQGDQRYVSREELARLGARAAAARGSSSGGSSGGSGGDGSSSGDGDWGEDDAAADGSGSGAAGGGGDGAPHQQHHRHPARAVEAGLREWARLLGAGAPLGEALRARALLAVEGEGRCRTLFVHAGAPARWLALLCIGFFWRQPRTAASINPLETPTPTHTLLRNPVRTPHPGLLPRTLRELVDAVDAAEAGAGGGGGEVEGGGGGGGEGAGSGGTGTAASDGSGSGTGVHEQGERQQQQPEPPSHQHRRQRRHDGGGGGGAGDAEPDRPPSLDARTVARINAATRRLLAGCVGGVCPFGGGRGRAQSLSTAQQRLAEAITGPAGPVWARALALAPENAVCPAVDALLAAVPGGAARVAVGHTVQEGGRARTRCGGRVLLLDTGMSSGMLDAPAAAFACRNGGGGEEAGARVLYADGRVDVV